MTNHNGNGNGNDYLSQEEIDALLNSTAGSGEGNGSKSEKDSPKSISVDDYLTEVEQDTLGEIGNITFGSSATALSTLLGKKVEITTPSVSIIPKNELEKTFPQPHVAVHVKFVEGFQGVNLLVIKTDDAKVIADLMLGGDGSNVEDELNEIHISAIQEAMNQMMGSAATSMSTIFNRLVNISPPGIDILDVTKDEGTSGLPDSDVLVSVSFRLKIEDLVDSSIMQLLSVSFSKEMVEGLLSQTVAAEAEEKQPAAPEAIVHEQPVQEEAPATGVSNQAPEPTPVSETKIEQPPQQAPQSIPPQPAYGYGQTASSGSLQRNVNVQPVEYPQFSQEAPLTPGEVNLNLLMDIPLKVTVELGRTKKMIKEILEFTQGSIIELDKLAGEPVDILVNNKLIAKGEVVVIDENFGVRVTDIVSQFDRLQKLK